MLRDIRVSCSPHISEHLSTRSVMIDVIIALLPAMGFAGYFFRIHALILIGTCVISCIATEWICNLICKKPNTLDDFSAVVTGIILALSLPPKLPIWTVVIGGVFSIAIGKMVFGGLGANIFNPAMVGRTFLTASFGVLMTTWTVPATIDPGMSKIGPENTLIPNTNEILTQATPLYWSKDAIKKDLGADYYHEVVFKSSIKGEIGGCLGETSVIALMIGGLYLLIRRTISFHIPLAVIVSAFIFASIAFLKDSFTYVSPWYHISSGGLLLCAFFIATDPVTAPLTKRGMWIFGIGVGALTMLIRIAGVYPEGVMFSILLMNAVTPLIDRFIRKIPVGGEPGV